MIDAVPIEVSAIKVWLVAPTTDDVPDTLLKSNLSSCINVSPTDTPVAVPVIEVTIATLSTVTFQARSVTPVLARSGMMRLVVPVPSRDSTVVAAEVRVSAFLAVSMECWESLVVVKRPAACVL